VASSVVTTFLTPYIMKASVPCYNFLYNHASEKLRAKIDQREQLVAEAEAATQSEDSHALADKARHAVRNTYLTKRLVNLFIKNMSAKDENNQSETNGK
jgi:CPA2 family monovalent cation:H+ antiporter-2